MKRRTISLLVIVLLLAGGTAAYLYATRDVGPVTVVGPDGEEIEAYGPQLEAREALLSAPRDVEIELAVDIPKKSESENPLHQQMYADGSVDLGNRNAELVYDFNDLANVAVTLVTSTPWMSSTSMVSATWRSLWTVPRGSASSRTTRRSRPSDVCAM